MKFGRKVVVTGYGWETPLGGGINQVWADLLEGKSGISTLPDCGIFDKITIGGTCKEFDVLQYTSKKEARRLSRFILLAASATAKAREFAKLDENSYQPLEVGAFISSGIGGAMDQVNIGRYFHRDGYGKISPFAVPGTIINMAAGYVSIKHNMQGPTLAISSACTSASQSIGHAARAIATGAAQAMICGGAESSITDFSYACFAKMGALSQLNDQPEKASRPWDIDRDGFVMSEGAAVLVLEAEENARKRGAPILAEISGFGESSDAYHLAAPRPDALGAINSMQLAMKDAGITPDDIGYVNMHATSTSTGDTAEILALKKIFTGAQPKINASKAMLGHMLGASGSAEAIIAILSLQHQKIHPCINIDNLDEACAYNQSTNIEQISTKHVASNSFGFGGHNATLIFSAME